MMGAILGPSPRAVRRLLHLGDQDIAHRYLRELLVQTPQFVPATSQLCCERLQRRQCIRDLAMLAPFTPFARFGQRDRNRIVTVAAASPTNFARVLR
jgi:hypothetical protein